MSGSGFDPGASGYFAVLLSRLQDLGAPPTLIKDPVILQSLLLCLISGNKHLLIRTRPADISSVARLTSSILATVFGLRTQKLKLRHALAPADLLRALFLSPPRALRRPSSHPSSIGTRARDGPTKGSLRPTPPHAPPEPSVIPRAPAEPTETTTVPDALVLTGLEHVGVPAQRCLFQTLLDGHFAAPDGAQRDLPPGFMVVSVCPDDAHEPPAIHPGLLDRFSVCAHVSISGAAHAPDDDPPSSSSPGGSGPPISHADLAALRTLRASVRVHPTLDLYLADLVSLARHHPELDGALLTVRAHKDAADVVRALRLLDGDTTGIRPRHPHPSPRTHDGHDEEDDLEEDDVEEKMEEEMEMEEEEEDAQTVHDPDRRSAGKSSAARTLVSRDALPLPLPARAMDASEADVRSAVPLAIAHRLRARASPEEQVLASLAFPAAQPPPDLSRWTRRSVQEILVNIVAGKE